MPPKAQRVPVRKRALAHPNIAIGAKVTRSALGKPLQ